MEISFHRQANRTACPTYSAKRLIQQGGAGGFACRSHGHNQWSASKLNKFPKTVMHPSGKGIGGQREFWGLRDFWVRIREVIESEEGFTLGAASKDLIAEIGRASCRERV